MKENKKENLTFRITPRYRGYLEMLADDAGKTLGGYINQMILLNTALLLQRMAYQKALHDAASELGVHEKIISVLNDTEMLESILPKEKYLILVKRQLELGHKYYEEVKKTYDLLEDEKEGNIIFDVEEEFGLVKIIEAGTAPNVVRQ